MSLRTLAFLGLYGLAIIMAFAFPPAGVWAFLFESNYHPAFYWWGDPLMVLGDRWSFLAGGVMIAATLLHWSRYSQVRVLDQPQTVLLLLFSANAFLVTAWAYEPSESWQEAVDLFKWFLAYICMVKTHSDRRWLPMLIYIYIFALIDFGYDETFDGGSGRSVDQGPVTARGENFVSSHAVAFIPLMVLLIGSPDVRLWLRVTLGLGMPFVMNLIAHASSRGAFLALLTAGGALLLFTKGRYRRLTLVAGVIGALLAMRLFHDQFWARMATIFDHESDGSAVGRKEAWAAARQLAERNPFGYGGEAFDSGLGAKIMGEGFHTTHNMFYEILVAWGIQGVLLFFGLIAVTLWDCYRMQRRHWRPGEWPQTRVYAEATGILCGMLSMLVASLFLNRLRWELWWVFTAYVVCLKNIYGYTDGADASESEYTSDEPEEVQPVGIAPARPFAQ